MFQKTLVIEKKPSKKRGISQFSVDIFFSQSAECFPNETLRCMRRTRVSIFLRIRFRGMSRFSAGFFFVSLNRRTSYGKTSLFQRFSGIDNFLDKRGGVVSIEYLHWKVFVSQGRILAWRNPSVSQTFRLSKHSMQSRVISRFAVKKLFSHSADKNPRKTIRCYRKFQE